MAAKCVLASTLITEDEIASFEETSRKRPRVGTGCQSVDDALDGGLVYGQEGVYNISGLHGTSAAETVSLQLLISHVMADETSTATFIDASGNFDVLRLYKCVMARLQKDGRFKSNEHEIVHERAISMLDRIKIMRVFDYQGVLEGVEEMIEELDHNVREGEQAPKSTIRDSQEEDEDVVDLTSSESSAVDTRQQQQRQPDGRGMVIIKNVSDVLNLVLRSNYARGQAMLTDLVRRLRQAVSKHNLCVVLVSWSVACRDDQESASVVESVRSRPGLGKTMSYLVDTQMMVDVVRHKTHSASERVSVIEVLSSRGMHQEGRYGMFAVGKDGELSETAAN